MGRHTSLCSLSVLCAILSICFHAEPAFSSPPGVGVTDAPPSETVRTTFMPSTEIPSTVAPATTTAAPPYTQLAAPPMFPIASVYVSQERAFDLFTEYFYTEFFAAMMPAMREAAINVTAHFNVSFNQPCDRSAKDSSVYSDFGYLRRPLLSNVHFDLVNDSLSIAVEDDAVLNLSGLVTGHIYTTGEAFCKEGTCATTCVCDGETFWICRPDSPTTLTVQFPFTLLMQLEPQPGGNMHLAPTPIVPVVFTVDLKCDSVNGGSLPPFARNFNETFILSATTALENFIQPVRDVISATLVDFASVLEATCEVRRAPYSNPSGLNVFFGYSQASTVNASGRPYAILLIMNASFTTTAANGTINTPIPFSTCEQQLIPDTIFPPLTIAGVRVSSAFLQAAVTAAYINGSFDMYNFHHILDATLKLNLSVTCPHVSIVQDALVMELVYGHANATCISCVTEKTLEVILASMHDIKINMNITEVGGFPQTLVYGIESYNFSESVFNIITPNGGFPQSFLTSFIERGFNDSKHVVDHTLAENGFGVPYIARCLLGDVDVNSTHKAEVSMSFHSFWYPCTANQGYIEFLTQTNVPTPQPVSPPSPPPTEGPFLLDISIYDGESCNVNTDTLYVHRVEYSAGYCDQMAVVDNNVFYFNITSVNETELRSSGSANSYTGLYPVTGKFFCDSSCEHCALSGNMSDFAECTPLLLNGSGFVDQRFSFSWAMRGTAAVAAPLQLCKKDAAVAPVTAVLTASGPACGGTPFLFSSPLALPANRTFITCTDSPTQGLISLNGSFDLFFNCGSKCPTTGAIQQLVCDSEQSIALVVGGTVGSKCVHASSSLRNSDIFVTTAPALPTCQYWTPTETEVVPTVVGAKEDSQLLLLLLVLLVIPFIAIAFLYRRYGNEAYAYASSNLLAARSLAEEFLQSQLALNELPSKLLLIYSGVSIYFGLATAVLSNFMFAGYTTEQFHNEGVPHAVSIDGMTDVLKSWSDAIRYSELAWSTVFIVFMISMISNSDRVPSTRIMQILVFSHILSIILVLLLPPLWMDVMSFANVAPLGPPGSIAGGASVHRNLDRLTSAISFFTLLPSILQSLLACSSACPLSACIASVAGEYFLTQRWRIDERHIRKMVLMTCWTIFPVSMGLSVFMFFQQTRDKVSLAFWLIQILGVTFGAVMLTLYHETMRRPCRWLALLGVADVLCILIAQAYASKPYGGAAGGVAFTIALHCMFGVAMTGCQLFFQFDVEAAKSWLTLKVSVVLKTKKDTPDAVGKAALALGVVAGYVLQRGELENVSRFQRRLWYRRLAACLITGLIIALVTLSSTDPPTIDSVRDWSISLLVNEGFAFPKNHTDIHLAWDPGLFKIATVKFDRRFFFYTAAAFSVAGLLMSTGVVGWLVPRVRRWRSLRPFGRESQVLLADPNPVFAEAIERLRQVDDLELTASKTFFALCFCCMIIATFYVDFPNYVAASQIQKDIPDCGVQFYHTFTWLLNQVTGMFFGLLVSGAMFPLLLALPATAVRVEFQVSSAIELEHCNAAFMTFVSLLSPIINIVPILLIAHLDTSPLTQRVCFSTLFTPLVMCVLFRIFRVRSVLGVHGSLLWMLVYLLHWFSLIVIESHNYPVVWTAVQHLAKEPTFYLEIFTDIFLSTVLLSDFLFFLMVDDDMDSRFDWALPPREAYSSNVQLQLQHAVDVASGTADGLCLAVAIFKSALLAKQLQYSSSGNLAKQMHNFSRSGMRGGIDFGAAAVDGSSVELLHLRATVRALRDAMFFGEHVGTLMPLLQALDAGSDYNAQPHNQGEHMMWIRRLGHAVSESIGVASITGILAVTEGKDIGSRIILGAVVRGTSSGRFSAVVRRQQAEWLHIQRHNNVYLSAPTDINAVTQLLKHLVVALVCEQKDPVEGPPQPRAEDDDEDAFMTYPASVSTTFTSSFQSQSVLNFTKSY